MANKPVVSAKKDLAKKKYNTGDNLVCELCGLSMTVDENQAYREESLVICCGEPMKEKAKKKATAAKK